MQPNPALPSSSTPAATPTHTGTFPPTGAATTPTSPLVWVRATALCLVLAPLLQVAEVAISPLGGDTFGQFEAIAAHESAFVISVLLGLAATVLYVPAFVGLAHAVAQRSPVLALVAALLSICSMVGFGGVRAVQGVQLELTQGAIDRDDAVALLDGANPIMAAVLVLFMAGTLVGLITLVIAVWRSGRFPKAPLVMVLAFVLFDMVGGPLSGGAGSTLVPVTSHLFFLAGLGWLGLVLWQQTRLGDETVERSGSANPPQEGLVPGSRA
ncbi:hypothetical protein MWU75_15955 [Ornithinimicrobium sp. F0845]|uniref:hypothetical protein n=1 Tax=Ornithinimicrobium sp. F0845 TaxID=2926412 RepID=UPI001FF40BE7|nr:hypothetical protein [Ornithinimicrobium sp. F0845]MCK0113641.1 hypothetical protein [Ornithinimicrobium sp. F0845]